MSSDELKKEVIENKDKREKVQPWTQVEQEIPVRSFTGYRVELGGWIRNDKLADRQKEMEEEDKNKESLNEERLNVYAPTKKN
ncbi:hypothetical protein RNJ44_01726 [Nakaseomyces bracarensis]|uniref:Uncharacterized protein n=1 Tax=Nakaseomyces bracarensis TaxID=273131 RepID=A0ABR4NNT4_9SACH